MLATRDPNRKPPDRQIRSATPTRGRTPRKPPLTLCHFNISLTFRYSFQSGRQKSQDPSQHGARRPDTQSPQPIHDRWAKRVSAPPTFANTAKGKPTAQDPASPNRSRPKNPEPQENSAPHLSLSLITPHLTSWDLNRLSFFPALRTRSSFFPFSRVLIPALFLFHLRDEVFPPFFPLPLFPLVGFAYFLKLLQRDGLPASSKLHWRSHKQGRAGA